MLRHLPIGAVLRLGIPLALAAAGNAIRLFSDRVMLSWQSSESLRAAMPGGITAFLVLCFFLGLGCYSHTLAAHSLGRGERNRLGACLWQGIWVALVGGLIMALVSLVIPAFFASLGHAPEVAAQEGRYTSILVAGGVFSLLSAVISGFWTTRGLTSLVVLVSLGQTALNIVLNWILIFGHWGAPAWGIEGAAWATIAAEAAGAAVYLGLFLNREHRAAFGTWPRQTFVPRLFARLVRFGLPQGVQMIVDLAAFNFLILLFAALPDPRVVEASTIAFSVNMVAIIPVFGFCRAIAVLVGQAMGGRDVARARLLVRAGLVLSSGYCLLFLLWFTLFPSSAVAIFAREGDVAQEGTMALAALMLVFVGLWMLFDGFWQVLAHGLAAAGDTRFTMIATAVLGWTGMVLPTWWLVRVEAPWWLLWTELVAVIFLSWAVFARRWLGRAWESHQVLEDPSTEVAPAVGIATS